MDIQYRDIEDKLHSPEDDQSSSLYPSSGYIPDIPDAYQKKHRLAGMPDRSETCRPIATTKPSPRKMTEPSLTSATTLDPPDKTVQYSSIPRRRPLFPPWHQLASTTKTDAGPRTVLPTPEPACHISNVASISTAHHHHRAELMPLPRPLHSIRTQGELTCIPGGMPECCV